MLKSRIASLAGSLIVHSGESGARLEITLPLGGVVVEMSITLILADDHALILDGLEKLFHLEKDFRIVARCLDGEETLAALRKQKPEILILDIRMPGKGGLAVLQAMKMKT